MGNAVRISTDVYGCVRRRVTWCSECHVLLYFYSTWLRGLLAGGAHCAEPVLRARPTGNTGNTKNTGVSTRKRVSHVPWNFRSTWLTVCYRQSIVFPVFIVFIVGLAPTLCIAPCALPAGASALCSAAYFLLDFAAKSSILSGKEKISWQKSSIIFWKP